MGQTICTPCSPSPCCNRSNATVCGDKDQAPTGLSAAAPTGPDEVSLAPTIPVSNVSHTSPSNIRGRLPSSDSTIRGGIAGSDSTNLHVLPSRSTESSLSLSDLPALGSKASSIATRTMRGLSQRLLRTQMRHRFSICCTMTRNSIRYVSTG